MQVTAEFGGQRLDQVLAARINDHTRSQIQRLIKRGMAHIGGKVGHASTVVREGDLITLEIPPPEPATPQPEALPVTVVYDDADLVVVDKPAGMVVHPAAGHSDGTLVNALLHHVKGPEWCWRRAPTGHRSSTGPRNIGTDGRRQT